MIRFLLLLVFVFLAAFAHANGLDLTASEKAWLQKHKVIRIGIDAGYAPYSFLDDDGKFIGVAPDILSLVESRLDIKFKAIPDLSWPEIVSAAKERSLDVIATAVITPERKDFLEFTRIYIPTPLVIMTRHDDHRIDEPDDLAKLKVALVKKYSSSQRVIQEQPDIEVVEVDTPLEGLRAVATGEAEAYVGVLGINVYQAAKHGITNLKVAGRYDVETNGQRLGVRKDWPVFAEILDKALDSIPESEVLSILQKWAPIVSETMPVKKDVNFLSREEQKFIEQHPVIRVANELDWAPFDFVDDDNQPAGYSIEYFSLIAKKAGLRVEWVNGVSWDTLLQYGRDRKVDVFPAIIENEERAGYLDFTRVYMENVPSYFIREDASIENITSTKQLTPYRLALVKGYADYESITKHFPELKIVAVNSILDGLKSVLTGDADIFIGDTAVCNYIIKENLLRNLKRAGSVNIPELQQNSQLHFAVRNDWPMLTTILNKVMAQVSKEELHTLQARWLDLPVPPLLTKERVVILIVLIIVVVVALTIIWIASLRRQRARLIQEIGEQNRILHENEHRLALALQSGEMVAWDTDYKTGVTVVSNGLWNLMGMPKNESANAWDCLQQLIHEEDCDLIKQAEADYLSGKAERLQVEYRIKCKDGMHWLINRGASVESDEKGLPLRVVGVIQDITESKNLERMKNEFISSVSHELRTPLTSIKGSLSLLSSGVVADIPQQANEMLRIAYENSERLIVLVNDILDIEKLLAGEMVFQKDKIVIGELISKAVIANQGYAEQYGVHFSVEDNECDTAIVIADEGRLLQVLSNLISNAIKYSPEGGSVKISTYCDDLKVRVAVTDQGAGVPKEFRDRIFTRFSQADSSDTREKGGTGLGLAISREIIERHGGKIGFDSPPEQGASFYFELNRCQSGKNDNT